MRIGQGRGIGDLTQGVERQLPTEATLCVQSAGPEGQLPYSWAKVVGAIAGGVGRGCHRVTELTID